MDNLTQRCSIQGNPDLYGLGIRLGVYFQLLSTLFANHFLPDALRSAWDANAVFLLAILVASLKSSVDKSGFTSPEAFVMLQMMLAFLLAVFNVSNNFWLLSEWISRFVEGTWYPGARTKDLLSELGLVRQNTSRLGISARSLLGLGIAAYNVWFWYGGSAGLDAGLNCKPKVFLFAQLTIHGGAKYLFMIFSMIYLIFRALPVARAVFPIHYLAALCGIIIHLYQSKKGDADAGRQAPEDRNQLLGPLDPRSLSDCPGTKTRRRRYDHRSSRRGKVITYYWHLITFSGSALVISWSIIAIESTLVWNGISGIYNVSSTGQLIPLVVGIAGMVKIAVQLAVLQRKKDHEKGPHGRPLDLGETSTWRYRLRNKRTVEFDATPQTRRWSLGDLEDAALKPLKKPSRPKHDRMAPVYPVLQRDEDWRVQEHVRNQGRGRLEVTILPWRARWLYLGSRGTSHVFHAHGPPQRRWSFDEGKESLQDSRCYKPHPARVKALVPLDQKRPLEDLLAEKRKWHLDEAKWRRRQGSHDRHSGQRLSRVSEDEIGPAGDLETGTPHQPDIVRRWSLPNLDDIDDPHGSMRHFSSTASSNLRRISEQANSGKSQVKTRPWILRSAVYVFKALLMLINMVFCCGPCTFLYLKRKQIKRRRRFGGRKAAMGLNRFALEAPDPICECSMCDLDIFDSGWDPDLPNTAGSLRGGLDVDNPSYAFSPLYTATVPFLLLYVPFNLLWQHSKRRKWSHKIKTIWNHEIIPGLDGARDEDRRPIHVHEVADAIRGRPFRRKYKREKLPDPESAEVHEDSAASSVEYDSDDSLQQEERARWWGQHFSAALLRRSEATKKSCPSRRE